MSGMYVDLLGVLLTFVLIVLTPHIWLLGVLVTAFYLFHITKHKELNYKGVVNTKKVLSIALLGSLVWPWLIVSSLLIHK